MFLINDPIPWNRVGSSQYDSQLRLWKRLLQSVYRALSMIFGFGWGQYVTAGHAPVRDYLPLEVLPDYYLNSDSAKRLWQDWRVLRRLFVRRDHSRDLLLQGQSGWLPIHGMCIHQQLLTITTDEGEKVLNLEEPVVWLSRANPANTQIRREPVWLAAEQPHSLLCPA
ncbi:hypothetical protein N836_14520 [Leptolyngbya sp. Heron Island J]|uniref:hypothetical protein n=1 Tax=Leptolyngbya sp. Heron Island J TaxID=1385935 RepID=UPI0003B9B619|nr:hypothetical protein [Leptolyngbya sp. Heron Island J]ESA34971.1 hypothetical protein N836_14520 [Leptolyngbya sp. Heron Island J]